MQKFSFKIDFSQPISKIMSKILKSVLPSYNINIEVDEFKNTYIIEAFSKSLKIKTNHPFMDYNTWLNLYKTKMITFEEFINLHTTNFKFTGTEVKTKKAGKNYFTGF
jgi:hypothetical protein